MQWLFDLPETLEDIVDCCTISISHGDVNGMFAYLYPDAKDLDINKNYSKQKITVLGHTHHAFIHSQHNKVLLNPGSVGQPRDISGLASYVIFDTKNNVFRFKRCQFNIKEIIKECKKVDPELDYLQSVLKR
jgi:predicted phosphodiesterase